MPFTKSEKQLYAILVARHGPIKARIFYHAMRNNAALRRPQAKKYGHFFGLAELNRSRKKMGLKRWRVNPYR